MTINRLSRQLLVVFLVLGAVAVFIFRGHFDIAALEVWVIEHPLSAPFLFVILYVVLTTLLFPSTVLSVTGGVLFGPAWGALYIQLSAMLSAALTFLLARHLWADWVESRLGQELRKLKKGVEKEGWRFVLLLRIVPGLPFSFLNYALGLTRIRLLHFLGVTFICILPRVIFYAYAGDTGKKAVAGEDISIENLIMLGLFTILIVLPYLLKRLKQRAI